MSKQIYLDVLSSIHQFIRWLDSYGETSHDHQSFFASSLGGKAKALYYRRPILGTAAVAPMIFCEAFLPSLRPLFSRRLRFPVADAHYAMGFGLLAEALNMQEYSDRAVHFLGELEKSRCSGYQDYCWGYPFNWETRTGTLTVGTPLITTTPYAYEAFQQVHRIDRDDKWLSIMHSIAEHAVSDIKDFHISPDASTCSYTPFDEGGVINASAYRAFLLTAASQQFSEERYWQIAERNLNFVLKYQRSDGSWYYSIEGARDFIDHFHTCFVLKALAKIERLTGHNVCARAIAKGVEYYLGNLLNENGLPKPFSKPPRLTVYKRELYDYAECINLCLLLRARFGELDRILRTVLEDLLRRWRKPDGSFRSRELLLGWDNVPMHRWAQSQLFRSLCLFLNEFDQR